MKRYNCETCGVEVVSVQQTNCLYCGLPIKESQENTLVIFGAPDYEEQMARRITSAVGAVGATATYFGSPVYPATAYKADGFSFDFGPVNESIERVVYFECAECAEDLPNRRSSHLCDHHNPGDHGYNKGPSQFYNASSLGQLCAFFGLSVNGAARVAGVSADELLMTAAGDHCPKDAYAGKCGIDPEKFFNFRVMQKAQWEIKKFPENVKNTTIGLIANGIAREILDAERALDLHKGKPGEIIDLTGYGTIPELPEAAMRLGVAYKTCIPETDREGNPTGNDKILLGGCTTPEQVEEFMKWAGTLENAVGVPYGNPTRGFAGVVVKR